MERGKGSSTQCALIHNVLAIPLKACAVVPALTATDDVYSY